MKVNKIIATFGLIGFVMYSPLSKAQTSGPDASLDFFKGMKYRNVGPGRGGRSLGVAGSVTRKNEYYFGAVGGGLWKTTDGGNNWKPVTDGQMGSSSVGPVAVAATNPDIVYFGTGEAEFRGNIMQGDGMYKSVDAGKTWKNIGLKNSQTISRVRIHPTNPDIVYVSVLGHAFNQNEDRGIYKTTDGGATWKKILYKGPKAGGADLIIDPNDPETLYATIWEVYRTPYKMWGGGGASGMFKSTDGGTTWTDLSTKPGMPKGPIGKIGITVSPVDSKRLWAVVESETGGVFRSDDAGATWKQTSADRGLIQRAFYYNRIYADPKDKNVVYVLNVQMHKSVDGGEKFTTIRVPHGDNHDMWIDPTDPNRMVQANDGGGTVSVNGGATWTDETFPTAQLYHIFATYDFPYHVVGAQQDNSTIAVASEGWGHMLAKNNTLKNIPWFYSVSGGESGYVAQDPNNHDIFYAGNYSNTLNRTNRVTGETRQVQPYPRYFMGEPAKTLPERFHWTFPIVFSPVDTKRLYVSSQHVWVTTNEGQTWDRISPDLTYADPESMGESGGVITNDMSGPELYATVYALAPSYFDVNTIWAGSDDGLLHITRDHGKNWVNITPPGLPKHSRISIIDASRHKAGTAYVAVKRYQTGDRAPYIFKTDDYGKTWKKIINGIPAGSFVHAVREDITRPGLLFAGTEHGVMVSFDDGEFWSSLQLNLPNTQVPDIAVTEKDIAIATHGRSMYILDDIAPIREFKPEVTTKQLHLFKPYYAVRKVQNAVFQYYLKSDATDLKIEILDPAGQVVQTFAGVKTEPKEDAGGDDEEWGPPAQKAPTMNKGLNVFNWNLRYPGASTFKGMVLWSARPQNGPMAPIGTYKVRVSSGGESTTHDFEVRLDPRVKNVSNADIEENFKLASQIREQTTKANDAVIKIRAVKEKIAAAGQTAQLKKVIAQLEKIEQTLYQTKNQSGQDPLNFPIRLNNKIASLQGIVEGSESKPTDDSYRVYKELAEEIGKEVQDLDKLMKSKELQKYAPPVA